MKTLEITNTGSKLTAEGGWLNYTIEEDEITIDIVCAEIPRQGIGSKLVKELQKIANEKGLKIGLYAEPCALCPTEIYEDGLIEFYKKLGFVCDADDTDGKLLVWK